MSLFAHAVPPMRQMIRNIEGWLDEAEATASERGFDAEILVEARLAPDMFPLRRQIQSLCDTAKFTACRLTGREAPKQPDEETTLAELRARLAWTGAFLDEFSEADFAGASERMLALPFLPDGMQIAAPAYLSGFALPNFYFHSSAAYNILRHNGIGLGKRKFIGALDLSPTG